MSRGLGRIQRALLIEMTISGKARWIDRRSLSYWVEHLCGLTRGAPADEAIRRALRTLADRGLVEIAQRGRQRTWQARATEAGLAEIERLRPTLTEEIEANLKEHRRRAERRVGT